MCILVLMMMCLFVWHLFLIKQRNQLRVYSNIARMNSLGPGFSRFVDPMPVIFAAVSMLGRRRLRNIEGSSMEVKVILFGRENPSLISHIQMVPLVTSDQTLVVISRRKQ